MTFTDRLTLRAASLEQLAEDASANSRPGSIEQLTAWSQRLRQQSADYQVADTLDAQLDPPPVSQPARKLAHA